MSRTLTLSIIGEWPPTGPLVTAIFRFLLSDQRIICHKSRSLWGGRDVGTIVASRNTTTPRISVGAAASHFISGHNMDTLLFPMSFFFPSLFLFTMIDVCGGGVQWWCFGAGVCRD